MGEHIVTCEFTYLSVIALQIGDFITFGTENYYINRLPTITKIDKNTFQYSIVFESVLYNLAKKLFISSDGLADYSYNGTATDFITNIVASINLIDPGWTVGIVDTSDNLTLQFSNESCRAALTRVAEAFKMEFSLVGRQINLLNLVGNITTTRFEYGRGLGLYKIERVQVQDQNIVTKVFGYGATKNIPYTYRSGAKRLTFAIAGMAASGCLVSSASGLYGVIEGQYTDDNIFPQRTGTLTGVSYPAATGWNTNTDYLTDSAMDFDINSYLIEGQTATIVLKSGDMSGVECEIWKYDNANKRFYITPFTDTDGTISPNTANYPRIGDSYTLVNISMPQSYVDTAEAALKAATQSFLDENCLPMVVYSVEIDPKYAASISVGDKVTVVDTDLGINSLIRISGVEYPLVNPYQIKATIADFVPYTLQERIIQATIDTIKETIFVDRRQAEMARRNTVNQKSLKDLLFDTDGYFDATNIKPLSIETAYLAVGTKSRDFWLSLVTIKANYLADANRIYISSGSLIHNQIQITGVGYTWVIGSSLDQGSLTPTSAYYLYAKCSKSALTAEWILSTSQITVEEVGGYYHFLVGLLFAVSSGYRDFDFAYGMTYINGNTITTGSIQSIDGNNYFDLALNKFRIGDANSSMDWNVTTGSKLTIKGGLVQSPGGTTAPILVNRGPYNAGYTYYIGEQVTYGGSTWNWINSTPGSGHTPAENAYWTLASSGGVGPQGTSILFQGSYASVASLITDKGALQEGWAYYNTVDKKSYVYFSATWHQMSVDGVSNVPGPGIVYRGAFSAVTVYYNNLLRRDIVKYTDDIYYIFKGTDGTSGAWSPGDWDSFGASFSSVATDLLFASLAYIDNLGVKYFSGVPIESGYFQGAIKIEGNDIWEDTVNDDLLSVIRINHYGYNKGATKNRILIIGSGTGVLLGRFSGVDDLSSGLHKGFEVGAGSVLVPRMNTYDRGLLDMVPGMIIYNTQTKQFEGVILNGSTPEWWKFTMHT